MSKNHNQKSTTQPNQPNHHAPKAQVAFRKETKKHILITGATRGLGKAMTQELIRQGHTIHACARNHSHIRQLTAAHPPPHTFTTLDITNDQAIAQWAKTHHTHNPPIDILINNAAQINQPAPLWKIPTQQFDTLIDTNIKGIANTIRHFLPHMIQNQRGILINFTSGWGRTTSPQVAPYCAAKWAIEGLTQALAQELPPNLAAIPLNPGIIHTDMLQTCLGKNAAQQHPTPQQWAKRAIPYILNLNTKHNGQPLTIPQ